MTIQPPGFRTLASSPTTKLTFGMWCRTPEAGDEVKRPAFERQPAARRRLHVGRRDSADPVFPEDIGRIDDSDRPDHCGDGHELVAIRGSEPERPIEESGRQEPVRVVRIQRVVHVPVRGGVSCAETGIPLFFIGVPRGDLLRVKVIAVQGLSSQVDIIVVHGMSARSDHAHSSIRRLSCQAVPRLPRGAGEGPPRLRRPRRLCDFGPLRTALVAVPFHNFPRPPRRLRQNDTTAETFGRGPEKADLIAITYCGRRNYDATYGRL